MKIKARLLISLVLIVSPSLFWLLMTQFQSPWWLENIFSSPVVILLIFFMLVIVLNQRISMRHGLVLLTINFILVLVLNNTVSFNNKPCQQAITFFQFNIKYTDSDKALDELIHHLIVEQYHLVTLQGVSQQSKQLLVERLSPYYPNFIRGESRYKQARSDQLLFSRYAFDNIKYFKSDYRTFLITSQWQLPAGEVHLLSLHPPSPRNETLWRTRNQILYQLKYALNASSLNNAVVIGDLNLSRHSKRINIFSQGMNTQFVNSWPNIYFGVTLVGLAIDHLWVSKPANICLRQGINLLSWSDHIAITTQVVFD